MKKAPGLIIISLLPVLFSCSTSRDNMETPVAGQWSIEKVSEWYAANPWLVGCNYYPATAINQIEMWQSSTWDPKTIETELNWAQEIGMNTMRVFLHRLVWEDDEKGLYARMDQFLDICTSRGIRPWFVFFDDCHFPEANLGPQPLPVRGYHNSGWLNCPQRELAVRYSKGEATRKETKSLKGYVQGTMRKFEDDDRILMWELYNEPGRGKALYEGGGGLEGGEEAFGDGSARLVYDSWVWAREVNPSQPITSTTAGSVGEKNIMINRINSDLHSVHSYSSPAGLWSRIEEYQSTGRPVIITEWLARGNGSTVEACLPLMKELNAGAVNWGFVSGKSGTIWPWSSRNGVNVHEERSAGNVIKPGDTFPEPEVWHHDIYRSDGTPYDSAEIRIFRELTGTID